MKERPILFTPTNAQLVFESKKTQTRRIIRPQPPDDAKIWRNENTGNFDVRRCDPWHTIACPFGGPGDRLIMKGSELATVGQELPTQRIGVTWLDLIHVRVERLQDITEEDAKAEGCQVPEILWPDSPREAHSYVENFKLLWESIHGDSSWELNPWVWVLDFQRVSRKPTGGGDEAGT